MLRTTLSKSTTGISRLPNRTYYNTNGPRNPQWVSHLVHSSAPMLQINPSHWPDLVVKVSQLLKICTEEQTRLLMEITSLVRMLSTESRQRSTKSTSILIIQHYAQLTFQPRQEEEKGQGRQQRASHLYQRTKQGLQQESRSIFRQVHERVRTIPFTCRCCNTDRAGLEQVSSGGPRCRFFSIVSCVCIVQHVSPLDS